MNLSDVIFMCFSVFLFEYIYRFGMKLYIYIQLFRVVCEDIYFAYKVTFLLLPSYMFICLY